MKATNSRLWSCAVYLLFGHLPTMSFGQEVDYFIVPEGSIAQAETVLLAEGNQSTSRADQVFFDARIALLRENLAEAERLFREVLSLEPAHSAARAYLGLTLAEMGRNSAAIYNYRFALADDLPSDVSRPIRDYILENDRGLGFNTFAYFHINRQTNPFLESNLTEIRVGDFIFALADPEGGTEETVLEFGGNLGYRFQVSETGHFLFRLRADFDHYTNSNFTSWSVTPSLAYEFRVDQDKELALGMSTDFEFLESELVEREIGPVLRLRWEHDERFRSSYFLEVLDLHSPGRQIASGVSYEIGAAFEKVLTPRWAVNGAASVYRAELQRKRLGYDEYRLVLGTRTVLPNGIRVGGAAYLEDRVYHADSRIFGVTRRDQTATISVTVGSSEVELAGFSPQVRVEYEERHSNIALYESTNSSVALEVTRSF
ncbi:surface lipoprotein assembly modifier [Qingshengfaniella alkalisoli]|uniref:DUF560 domain-containing protein n=1 Tax=Qingshengfaniella alkalisoli TaxID=2599296 RepID=A0A5B8J2K1_9RHOB|nr:surface lipoprotein assembly modifier [Qingshengfaniella alkalisoli]QDY70998.1 DUF560 domain-containing protein [Qingshengfaniella alkalisoli]